LKKLFFAIFDKVLFDEVDPLLIRPNLYLLNLLLLGDATSFVPNYLWSLKKILGSKQD
jgi:hypothetical protein